MTKGLFYNNYCGEAYFNMAMDEWLMRRAAEIPASLFLRLYTWQAPTITIGTNQRFETAVDHASLGKTVVIRRVTGGRAVYHDLSELTYSIVVNRERLENDNFTGSLSHTLEMIAGALGSFLREVGVSSDYVRSSSRRHSEKGFLHKAPCFAANARFELVSENRKVVASAQRRTGSVLLQQGSIKLFGVAPHRALTHLPETAVTSGELIASNVFTEYCGTFRRAVGQYLDIEFVSGVLFDDEIDKIRNLARRKKKFSERTEPLNKPTF